MVRSGGRSSRIYYNTVVNGAATVYSELVFMAFGCDRSHLPKYPWPAVIYQTLSRACVSACAYILREGAGHQTSVCKSLAARHTHTHTHAQSLSLSLSLSHTRTHTHTHTHTQCLLLTHSIHFSFLFRPHTQSSQPVSGYDIS